MIFMDLFRLCLRNLYRRKGRTFLTVSGVVIGCCSIVIMVSMGIGMKRSQDEMIAQMGNLTRITVSPSYSVSAKKKLLDKKAVRELEALPGVKAAIAKSTLDLGDLLLVSGEKNRYQCSYASTAGVSEKEFEKMGYTLAEGKFPEKKAFAILAGKHFAYQFTDSKRPEGKNSIDYYADETAKPYFEPLNAEITVAQRTETRSGNEEGLLAAGSSVKWKSIQTMNIVGITEENYDIGDETDSGIILRLNDLERLQKMVQKLTGQKISKEYAQVYVDVDRIEQVEAVQESIDALGFTTYSLESIRKPMEKEAQQKQMMLGGLGAVSLFVAAIGIANTMVMSITERTREIGVMKALGCYLGDIRKEFLLEAAMIGFLGGILGVGLSFLISRLMNYVSLLSAAGGDMDSFMTDSLSLTGTAGEISVIPLWLAGFALLFSILIGVAAGYCPANRAVKISALEAMKG